MTLEDVQARPDSRGVILDEVGVSGLRYPIAVLDRERGKQETVGEFSLSVRLAEDVKGAHMSRFVELVGQHAGEVTARTLPAMLHSLRSRLGSLEATVVVEFPYFLERQAPVSRSAALMDYQSRWAARATGDEEVLTLTVKVPVTSVCPCSKAISDYGAHNQRGYITISVRLQDPSSEPSEPVWIEELIELAERSASAPVLPLVKRPDERALTMRAYDNPVFVEDMVRGVVLDLKADDRFASFRVEAVNDESIHNHAAFARYTSEGWLDIASEPFFDA